MSEPVPESFTGVRCQQMVGRGAMSYSCERPQGHLDTGEPHYARDAASSVNEWRRWKKAQPEPQPVHNHTYKVKGRNVVCTNCGDTLPIESPEPVAEPGSIEEAFSAVSGAQNKVTGEAKGWATHDPAPPSVSPADTYQDPPPPVAQGIAPLSDNASLRPHVEAEIRNALSNHQEQLVAWLADAVLNSLGVK